MPMNITAVILVLLSAFALAGCRGFGERIVVFLFYREAELAQGKVYEDLKYRVGSSADPRKHRLDLYAPAGSGWPVLMFVHGGGWRSGDKSLEFGGADPYGNIGRFYASHGIGVALVNYRLQPEVSWREQVADVAQALAWVYTHADDYGADKHAIFVAGHSSGAQLAARVAVDQNLLRKLRLPRDVPCGVIAVSGAPFDISDSKSYELGTNPKRYEKLFRAGDDGERWKYEASAVNFITSSAPSFLLLHGYWEPKGLQRQNQVMYEALKTAGVSSQLVVTPWDNHFLIVGALSHPDRIASAVILDFIRLTQCPPARAIYE